MRKSGLFAWAGVAIGVGAAMAVALDDVAVGVAIGAAVATAMSGRLFCGGVCGSTARPKE